jgi:hypothetical protein
MGLGKKLGQLNTTTNSQLETAKVPVSEGGYNPSNIPTLRTAPAITYSEVKTIQTLSAEARTEYTGREVNRYGLVKPRTPDGSAFPNRDVSQLVVDKMWRIICINELHAFYTQDQLQTLVDRACKHDYRTLQLIWELPTIDMAVDLAVLGLYDIVLFLDDSGSMEYHEMSEGMKRFDLLKEITRTCAFWGTLMDPDGIVVRFFNSNVEGNGLSSVKEVDQLFSGVSPSGTTPLGRELENKILNKIVMPVLSSGGLNRPVLVITITDGSPDSTADVITAITKCRDAGIRSKYGSHMMSFGFAQVGSDSKATAYLGSLDKDPHIGKFIDATSEYSIEEKECGSGFTPAAWTVKLLIGSVDPSYDQSDE